MKDGVTYKGSEAKQQSVLNSTIAGGWYWHETMNFLAQLFHAQEP